MQAPVTKRKARTTVEVGETNKMAALAVAATRVETMKKRRASIRSAKPRTALVRVPATNPACTVLVKREAWVGVNANSAAIEGTTAEAENQSAMAATSHDARIARDTAFVSIIFPCARAFSS